ncbi:hypothetical protein MMO39_12535 [Acinetobacter modestus]|uniref:hypothetical protein n=1 Tax=Acinetobacter modestus TaxID=1776740 RepID=UPI001F4A3B0C|nr:hypothetical protein [Acinetobacter modestus]MCH7388120.1 hypothetical protein [Acinetobacter modestus]
MQVEKIRHNSSVEPRVQDVEYILDKYDDEDLIWLLHLFNLSIEDLKNRAQVKFDNRTVLRKDIEKINTVIGLKEIKYYIQSELRNDYELENEFIKNIKSYSNKIQSRELFSKIKKDDIRCILCIN